MNANPQAAAEQARKTYRDVAAQLGHLGLDTAVPEGVRALAEKAVAQTREVYDRSKDAFDASLTTFERILRRCRPRCCGVQPQDRRHCPAQCRCELRPGQELSGRQEAYRYRGVAGGLLAEAVRGADGPGRGGPRAIDQADGRCCRADQGARNA